MTETTYTKVFTQFLNEYWGSFHEVLEAQSVNPRRLAPPLFDALIAAHRRFASVDEFARRAVERLNTLWGTVAKRRDDADAPLTAREIQYARAQFEAIHDLLMARGKVFPRAAAEALAHAVHAHPRAALRADAARRPPASGLDWRYRMDGSNVSTTDEPSAADIRPRGTLVIMAIFAAVFALSWLGTYFVVFLQRGTPRP